MDKKTASEAVKWAMAEAGITQKDLAEKIGKSGQSSISNALSRQNGMRVDSFLEMITALGYEVVVRRGAKEVELTK